jgi:hypothetical protein
MANRRERETLPQNTGHPVPSTPADKWRDSVLVGPQTAGIPTVHNEDSWVRDSDALPSSDDMVPGMTNDKTGGALGYHRSERRK